MSRTNETRHIEWHKTYICKCRLDVSVCNKKQRWNKDKYRCECKELNCNCECEFGKSCDVGEYLDYENCKCRKNLGDKLVEECTENIDENEMIYNGTLHNYKNVCNFCNAKNNIKQF